MPRHKKPAAIKERNGNPGRRKIQKEPNVERGVPTMPDCLDKVGREVWQRTVPLLVNAKILSPLDRESLALYCDAWSGYLAAKAILAKQGDYLHTQSGVKRHPAFTTAKECADRIRALASDLGLNASARTKLDAGDAVGELRAEVVTRLLDGPSASAAKEKAKV